MNQTELSEIIANGENSGVEFKRDDVRPEQVARELVAMANFKGGRLFLGIEDNSTISGLTRKGTDCERWIMDTVFKHYIAPPDYTFLRRNPNGQRQGSRNYYRTGWHETLCREPERPARYIHKNRQHQSTGNKGANYPFGTGIRVGSLRNIPCIRFWVFRH